VQHGAQPQRTRGKIVPGPATVEIGQQALLDRLADIEQHVVPGLGIERPVRRRRFQAGQDNQGVHVPNRQPAMITRIRPARSGTATTFAGTTAAISASAAPGAATATAMTTACPALRWLALEQCRKVGIGGAGRGLHDQPDLVPADLLDQPVQSSAPNGAAAGRVAQHDHVGRQSTRDPDQRGTVDVPRFHRAQINGNVALLILFRAAHDPDTGRQVSATDVAERLGRVEQPLQFVRAPANNREPSLFLAHQIGMLRVLPRPTDLAIPTLSPRGGGT
jgi:hypothetical protein